MKRFKAHAYLLVILILNVSLFTGCGTNGETGKWLPDGKAPTTATTPATPTTPTTPATQATPVAAPSGSWHAPTVTSTIPANLATGVLVNSTVSATFSEAMIPATINTATFTLYNGVTPVLGAVTYSGITATFTPSAFLAYNTTYTARITIGALALSTAALASDYVWTFTTVGGVLASLPNLGTAARFGNLSGTAGMTNTGLNTLIVGGDLGSTTVANVNVTGFHDSAVSDVYTETGANVGGVSGKIFTCTNSTTGPTCAVCIAPLTANAASCLIATNGLTDATTAYNTLAGLAPGTTPLPNLANQTLAPGTYTTAGGILIQGGDLTLDAGGDPNAVWVFQIGTTLTVGGPGAINPQNVILTGGALASHVFWQVGGVGVYLNAAGGGTMQGTIIATNFIHISTFGNVAPVTLNGRAISLNASTTMVNTVINVQ